MTNTRYFFAVNTPRIVLVNMRAIVICVFQILQMLVNHIGGWKCTLGRMRNTLPGGVGYNLGFNFPHLNILQGNPL